MRLKEALADIPGVAQAADSPDIRGITYDSRQVEPGFLFVAMKGEKTDGNAFVCQAVGRGAVAVASEQTHPAEPGVTFLRVDDARKFLAQISRSFFGDPSKRLTLAGITGTNGKTTTSFLLDSIFRHAGLRSCLAGTLGLKAGDKPYPSVHTTPEASDLTSFLHLAVGQGCTHGAVEVSSHALVLKRVWGTTFRVAVFTNVTPEHLDFHGDMESYFQAKRLLFLPQGENGVETAVINIDDAYGRRLKEDIRCRVLTYGFSPEADVHVLDWRGRIDMTEARIATPGGELAIRAHLVGRPHIYNIMAATGAALKTGISLDSIRHGIESLEGVPGRMQLVRAGQPFTVIVDYAHTPDAMEKLLETVAGLPHGRVITVFGCGGDRDRKKRPVMGEIAGRMSDFVIATSDNPRTEDPMAILAEIEPGLQKATRSYLINADRREAIGAAFSMAHDGDVVVIAGKGHEDYQIIGNRTYPFDDRAVSRELLGEILNPSSTRSTR